MFKIPGEKDYSAPEAIADVNMEAPTVILFERMTETDITARQLFDEFYEKEVPARGHPRAIIELAQEYLPKIAEARKLRDEAFETYKERLLMTIEYHPAYDSWKKQLGQE